MTDVAAVTAELDKLEAKIKAYEAAPAPAPSTESADLDAILARVKSLTESVPPPALVTGGTPAVPPAGPPSPSSSVASPSSSTPSDAAGAGAWTPGG